MTTIYDVAVVGAGPAGRVLAHRALAAGLRVAVVDPAPDRRWSATYGVYTADLPDWFDSSVIAAAAPSVTVFTPTEQVVPHAYAILDTALFQDALTLDAADVFDRYAATLSARLVTCADGSHVRARHVVDARGARAADHPARPRQTAAGSVAHSDDPTMVLMDWRPAHRLPLTGAPASFSYRVALGGGRRLVEETCLVGAPPIDVDVLAERNRLRTAQPRVDEVVDFPLLADTRPWARAANSPLRFGAAGGLMNPATGYSVGQSVRASDVVVEAILAGRDPHEALWSTRARLAYRLRTLGLRVLLSLRPDELVAFFDAFFRTDPVLQHRYLCGRDDAVGVLRTMAAVFAQAPMPLRVRVAASTVCWRPCNTRRLSRRASS
ncbi:lycopene cyclase family protein [Gordonia sp. HY285]|uniref:lycopene cyclase family protein n=1 Tax=Gordonia liuliyuniae TaxID=2911517 RepID=UPI001F2FAA2D|nr:lycopene cyclase family protein [Gordonia liuliyuniae]MCF8610647.1 lycopene cyclase family protein [Gordonia liuliyuniae]